MSGLPAQQLNEISFLLGVPAGEGTGAPGLQSGWDPAPAGWAGTWLVWLLLGAPEGRQEPAGEARYGHTPFPNSSPKRLLCCHRVCRATRLCPKTQRFAFIQNYLLPFRLSKNPNQTYLPTQPPLPIPQKLKQRKNPTPGGENLPAARHRATGLNHAKVMGLRRRCRVLSQPSLQARALRRGKPHGPVSCVVRTVFRWAGAAC